MEVKKSLEYWYALIGAYTKEKCPECQSLVLENMNGRKWCSKCFWSNDEQFTRDSIALFGND